MRHPLDPRLAPPSGDLPGTAPLGQRTPQAHPARQDRPFKRSFLGYRPREVRAALDAAARDAAASADALRARDAKISDLEQVTARLGERIVDRDRELREVRDELADSLARAADDTRALVVLAKQVDEIRAQARGQATRIRLRALHDAADLSEKFADLAKRPGAAGNRLIATLEETVRRLGAEDLFAEPEPATSNGHAPAPDPKDLFDGLVHVDVGPLSDFSQLVLFEDAARSIGATSEISIKRFSEGRAQMALQLREPVALLRELEERCDLEFVVRDMRRDRVVLDVDSDAGADAEAA
jgi:cell division septum initiation protein DivIVA